MGREVLWLVPVGATPADEQGKTGTPGSNPSRREHTMKTAITALATTGAHYHNRPRRHRRPPRPQRISGVGVPGFPRINRGSSARPGGHARAWDDQGTDGDPNRGRGQGHGPTRGRSSPRSVAPVPRGHGDGRPGAEWPGEAERNVWKRTPRKDTSFGPTEGRPQPDPRFTGVDATGSPRCSSVKRPSCGNTLVGGPFRRAACIPKTRPPAQGA